MAGIFELKTTAAGHFLFNLKSSNGEVILTSQQYESRSSAENGIESVRKNAVLDERFERKTSKAGEPFFVLTARNGQTIGQGEMYSSASAMENGIESVKRNAPEAKLKDLTGSLSPTEELVLSMLSPVGRSDDAELVVEVDVPEGISDDEVLAVIGRLSSEVDDYHRALGGHGLKVNRLEIHNGAPTPVGVPSE